MWSYEFQITTAKAKASPTIILAEMRHSYHERISVLVIM